MAAAELTVVLVPRDSAALGEDPARIAGGRDSERSHQGTNISHFFSSSGVFFLSRFNMDTVPHNPGPCRFGKWNTALILAELGLSKYLRLNDSVCGWRLIDVSSELGSPTVVVMGGGLGRCPTTTPRRQTTLHHLPLQLYSTQHAQNFTYIIYVLWFFFT